MVQYGAYHEEHYQGVSFFLSDARLVAAFCRDLYKVSHSTKQAKYQQPQHQHQQQKNTPFIFHFGRNYFLYFFHFYKTGLIHFFAGRFFRAVIVAWFEPVFRTAFSIASIVDFKKPK